MWADLEKRTEEICFCKLQQLVKDITQQTTTSQQYSNNKKCKETIYSTWDDELSDIRWISISGDKEWHRVRQFLEMRQKMREWLPCCYARWINITGIGRLLLFSHISLNAAFSPPLCPRWTSHQEAPWWGQICVFYISLNKPRRSFSMCRARLISWINRGSNA